MDGMLSQEEINALLSSMGAGDDQPSQSEESALLTDEEKDAIGEISNISMGTAATTLFSLVNHKVTITTPVVNYTTWDELVDSYQKPCVCIQISYVDGLDGNNILILKEADAKIITDLMLGGDGTNTDGELTELHLSAICEAMNQMMGSAATSVSSMLEKRVDISPPSASLVNLNDVSETQIADFLQGSFVRVSFRMVIGDLVDSELMQLYPLSFAKDLYNQFMNNTSVEADIPTSEPLTPTTNPQPQPATPQPQMNMSQGVQADNQMGMPYPANPMQGMQPQMGMPYPANPMQGMQPQMGMPYPANPMQGMQPQMGMPYPGMQPQAMQDVNVQPAQFAQFSSNMGVVAQPENIDLLMDVPLEVTVELGRTSKSIKDILDFSPGTIIELNRLAGEPIDVLVNGKFVAKGEVVVIEEVFGIRVTEITKHN